MCGSLLITFICDSFNVLKFYFIYEFRLKLPGRFYELNIHYGLFVGGLGDFREIFLGLWDNFRGCLNDLQYNGVDVLAKVKDREKSGSSSGSTAVVQVNHIFIWIDAPIWCWYAYTVVVVGDGVCISDHLSSSKKHGIDGWIKRVGRGPSVGVDFWTGEWVFHGSGRYFFSIFPLRTTCHIERWRVH